MSDTNTPEAGERCKVKTDGGEEIAVWTGHVWCTADGSRILDADSIQSWTEAPQEGELTIRQQDEGE